MDLRALIVSTAVFITFIFAWHLYTLEPSLAGSVQDEYASLVAGPGETARLPGPYQVFTLAAEILADPFYDKGPNDKGIGIQLIYSVARVFIGYTAACLLAIPLGFVIGMSPTLLRALNPFIQLLKPISPLAWMPLALFIIKDSIWSSVFVIFICSVWPILINTSFGVSNVNKDYINVAKTLELGPLRTALTVILPAAAPAIVTGMRISIGISWLVIVAAEMLVGGTGVGYFVWNEWNNLDLASVMVTILFIGLVGMLLDFALAQLGHAVSYEEI